MDVSINGSIISASNWITNKQVNDLFQNKYPEFAVDIKESIVFNAENFDVILKHGDFEDIKRFNVVDFDSTWIEVESIDKQRKKLWWSKDILEFYNEFLTKIK